MSAIEIAVTCDKWFAKMQTDCRKCSVCSEPIYSDMLVLLMQLHVGGESIGNVIETDVALCQSCCEIIKEQL